MTNSSLDVKKSEGSFRLSKDTSALTTVGEKVQLLVIPAGSVITVSERQAPSERGMVEVVWADKTCRMFAVDLERRGEPV